MLDFCFYFFVEFEEPLYLGPNRDSMLNTKLFSEIKKVFCNFSACMPFVVVIFSMVMMCKMEQGF